jgi:hypothetical protein
MLIFCENILLFLIKSLKISNISKNNESTKGHFDKIINIRVKWFGK